MRYLTALILLAACQVTPVPQPPPPAPPDPPPPPAPATECEKAFSHMGSLGCSPVPPATGTWTDACENARANGVPFGTKCIIAASVVADIPNCGVDCQDPGK